LTELDDSDEYESLTQHLTEIYQPVGDLEKFLVHRIAFHIIRLLRTERLEAEYITGELHPPVRGKGEHEVIAEVFCGRGVIDEGLPAAIGAASAVNLFSGFQRYETALDNKLYRTINLLERVQRTRRGEFVPAPQAVDLSIHGPERET